MYTTRYGLVASFLAAGVLIACGAQNVDVGENFPKVADAATPPPSFGTSDAGADGGAAASFCAGSGPAVPVPIFGSCTGDIAKKTFRFAVCSCTNINFNGALVTDATRSSTGVSSATAGSVGVDGTYSGASSATHIGGSLWTNGDTAMSGHAIAGDLQCGGNMVVDGPSRVGGEAFVAGGVQGVLTVDGALHIPAGQPHTQVAAGRGTAVEAVTVAPPCDCSKPLDIGSIVADFKSHNDNAVVGLAVGTLANVDTDRSLTLPCGRYFLASVGGGAPLTIRVTGRTALAIGGSLIHNLTPVTFAVDPGAELDLFVAGDVLFSGSVALGDKARAAATRLYVGGVFGYDGKLDLAANVYLPNGAFTTTTSGTEIWGSIFAKNVGVTGDLTVHYDPSILDVDGCAPSGSTCGSCHDCANPSPACKNGVCGACQADSDCCPPLHCNAGACVPDIR